MIHISISVLKELENKNIKYEIEKQLKNNICTECTSDAHVSAIRAVLTMFSKVSVKVLAMSPVKFWLYSYNLRLTIV